MMKRRVSILLALALVLGLLAVPAAAAENGFTLTGAKGGSNFFKLRDLGQALGFNVGYSKEKGVFIEMDRPYDYDD